ncbi:hypothetical protein FGIG_08926 [Fasciola gigantica]|uniref:Uncharacterized protein n=1 Tax=Fasciola gigantica TaxID=46835 RepID=A0A504YF21_FASGI|nr:hypothetical protein FGIG_08926 [Fasciola gigantica]
MSIGTLLLPFRKIRQKRWTLFVLVSLISFGFVQYYRSGTPWPMEYMETRWRASGAYEHRMPWVPISQKQSQMKVYIVEEHHEVIPFWVDIVKAFGGRKATLVSSRNDLD